MSVEKTNIATSDMPAERETQPQGDKRATDEADIRTRPHGGKSAVESETPPDGEGNESDFWVKRPHSG